MFLCDTECNLYWSFTVNRSQFQSQASSFCQPSCCLLEIPREEERIQKPVQNRNTMEMLYWVRAFNTCISLRLCRKVFLPDWVTCTNPTAWDYNLHPATIFGQDIRLFLCLFCEPCWLFQLCRLQSLRLSFFFSGCLEFRRSWMLRGCSVVVHYSSF